jgi:hypothetical protein
MKNLFCGIDIYKGFMNNYFFLSDSNDYENRIFVDNSKLTDQPPFQFGMFFTKKK